MNVCSRSHYYAQLGNALQKHLFAYSALIMRTLKDPLTEFLISVSKSNILQGVWLGSICPNIPIRSEINANKKRRYTTHLKDNVILIIFY